MPAVARTSTPWPVVAYIALQLAQRGHRAMAVTMLVGFINYFRPGTNMKIRRRDLIPPTAGVSHLWSFLTHPTEMGQPSKTGSFDDSVIWDTDFLAWVTRAFEILKVGDPNLPLWPFSYSVLTSQVAKITKETGLHFVPYQLRHAGPAHDRLHNLRPLLEVQKRGGWRSHRSLVRYGNTARVSAKFQKLPDNMKTECLTVPDQLEGAILGPGAKARPSSMICSAVLAVSPGDCAALGNAFKSTRLVRVYSMI